MERKGNHQGNRIKFRQLSRPADQKRIAGRTMSGERAGANGARTGNETSRPAHQTRRGRRENNESNGGKRDASTRTTFPVSTRHTTPTIVESRSEWLSFCVCNWPAREDVPRTPTRLNSNAIGCVHRGGHWSPTKYTDLIKSASILPRGCILISLPIAWTRPSRRTPVNCCHWLRLPETDLVQITPHINHLDDTMTTFVMGWIGYGFIPQLLGCHQF